jgi:hypothetical protein
MMQIKGENSAERAQQKTSNIKECRGYALLGFSGYFRPFICKRKSASAIY